MNLRHIVRDIPRLAVIALLIPATAQAQPLLQTLDVIDVGFELKTAEDESGKGLPFAVYRAGQGIAADGERFYTSAGALTQDQQLFRYDPFWAAEFLAAENEIHFNDYRDTIGLRHIGDIAAGPQFLYAPLSDYFPGIDLPRQKLHLAWFSLTTLAYEGHLDVSHWAAQRGVGSGDIAGVAVRDGWLFVVAYQRESLPLVYALPLTDGVPTESGMATYAIASPYANGIAFYGNYAFVTNDPTNDDGEGLLDVYAIAELSEDQVALPTASYRYETLYTHGEGLTFYGDQLWVADGPAVRRIENPFAPSDDPPYNGPLPAKGWTGIQRMETALQEEFTKSGGGPDHVTFTIDPTATPIPAILAEPVSPVYRIAPQGTYTGPVTLSIPVPAGRTPDELGIYYFSESPNHRGWYAGENVTGWLVPNSRRTEHHRGTTFLLFEVHHSGVLQLGRPLTVRLGAAFAVEGTRTQWLAATALLILLTLLWKRIGRPCREERQP